MATPDSPFGNSPFRKRLIALWGLLKDAWQSFRTRMRVLLTLLPERFGKGRSRGQKTNSGMSPISDPEPLDPVPSVPKPPDDLIPPLRES